MITVTESIPDKLFDFAALEKGLLAAINTAVEESHVQFKVIISGFSSENKFDFVVQKAKKQDNVIEGSVFTNNENFVRLNNGTEDHVVGTGGKLMSFQPKYVRKTVPGVVGSRRGGGSGNRVVARGPWIVSGIKAGNWDEVIRNRVAPKFHDNVNNIAFK